MTPRVRGAGGSTTREELTRTPISTRIYIRQISPCHTIVAKHQLPSASGTNQRSVKVRHIMRERWRHYRRGGLKRQAALAPHLSRRWRRGALLAHQRVRDVDLAQYRRGNALLGRRLDHEVDRLRRGEPPCSSTSSMTPPGMPGAGRYWACTNCKFCVSRCRARMHKRAIGRLLNEAESTPRAPRRGTAGENGSDGRDRVLEAISRARDRAYTANCNLCG